MISGLAVLPHFVDYEEEQFLLSQFCDSSQQWQHSEGQRPTIQFGSRYDYARRTLDVAAPIPTWLLPFCHRISGTAFGSVPQQIIVNQYDVSDGIAPHIDHQTIFGPVVASLNLASSTVLTLHKGHKSGHEVPVLLQPRTLLLLDAEARYEWFHEIKSERSLTADDLRVEKHKRYSIT